LLRYGWHLCGTFQQEDNSGGSNGCTMRFTNEQSDTENAGFEKSRALIKQVKDQ
jgi:catalase (peroxidase I)